MDSLLISSTCACLDDGADVATFVASLLRVPMVYRCSFDLPFLVLSAFFWAHPFTPDTLDQAARWPISMIAVLLYVPIITFVITWFYSRIARLDPATALFSATPGGLTPMVVLGAAAGGNEQKSP